MTSDSTQTDENRRIELLATVAVLVVALSALVVSAGIAPASAAEGTVMQTNTTNNTTTVPGYYENSSGADGVGIGSWLEGRTDPTLDNMTALATRVGPFVIGSGTAQGGGPAGTLLLSLVVGGLFIGSMLRAPVGSVGGGVLGVVVVSGMASVGLVPTWIWAAVLMGIGSVLAAVAIRAWR